MMNFHLLDSPRLILKGISTAYMTFIFEQHSPQEIKTLLGHRSEEDYEKELYKYQNGYASYNRKFMLFLLTDKLTGNIIGRCGLHNWNAEQHRAEIGYIMHHDTYKQKGLMTEAVATVINFGFGSLKLNRIEALVGTGNVPSLRIMEKFHFVHEGTLRQHHYSTDHYEDSYLFSILANEYKNDKIVVLS